METKANYALIGAFTLAVISAAFLFVFWFSGGAARTERKTYEIIFSGSVSGLSRGGSVTFNGLRVGEVTAIDLMQQDPSRVAAFIEISQRTPVKDDTRARLEFQGLTGVASIALTGGSATSPELPPRTSKGGGVIFADRSDFQNLLESVQRLSAKADSVLERADKLLGDNSGSITATLKNVETFSKSLADSSDGIGAFITGMADLGQTIKPLAGKLETLTENVTKLVASVDPDQVKAIVGNAQKFSQSLAESEKDLTSILAEGATLARKLNDTAAKVDEVLSLAGGALTSFDPKKVASIVDNADAFMKTLDRNRANVDGAMKDARELTAKLNKAADQIDGVMKSVQGFLGNGDSKGMFQEVGEAAKAIRKLADNLDTRTREMMIGINRFTGPVAREYEALAAEGRRTIGEINRAVKSIERNPQQFIFGGKPSIPEYSPR